VLIIAPEDVRPGMKLAAAVPHPDNPEQHLLKGGYILEAAVIGRLREMRIDQVYVEYPALDDLDRHLVPNLSPARRAIYFQIRDAVTTTQRVTRAALPYAQYCNTTRQLITTLMDQGQHPIFLDQMARRGEDAVGHAAAVAHLSLMLGLTLEQYLIDQRKRLPPHKARDVVNLGVAAMLHDIGKCALPDDLHAYSEVDPPAHTGLLDQWRAHAQIGYEMVREHVEPTAAAAILHHHRHFDGGEFACGTGSESDDHKAATPCKSKPPITNARVPIHVFARIIHAANLYDRLATSLPNRRRSNLEVLHRIRGQHDGWLDPIILRALESIAPPFPPGTKLSLTDGSDAVVIRLDPADPYFPVVRRLAGTELRFQGEPIDLREHGSPRIRQIGPVQIASFMPRRTLTCA